MPVQTIERVQDLLGDGGRSERDLAILAEEAGTLTVADLSYLIRTTGDPDSSALLFRVLGEDTALAVFESLSPSDRADLVSSLRSNEIAELITELAPDDRVVLFDEMPAAVTEELTKGLSREERELTATVLGYPKRAIGRRMSPEVISLHEDWTVAEALDFVQENLDTAETVYMLPVVDRTRRVLGVVGLRRLLRSDSGDRIGDLAKPAISARATDDREDTARRFRAEHLLAMPIVDNENRLVGVLTVDDASDIVDEEDAENAARTGGAEPLRGSYLSTTILGIVRSRVVWLLVLAISAILTVQVLGLFEDRLDEVVVLALFIPLLTGTGGNAGNQAATTVTRALAVDEVRVRDLPRVVWRELRIGVVLGAILGGIGVVIAGLVFGFDIGLVIGLTLLAVCTMAACVGGIMPLIASRIGADPAVFSNPFISTFCDATGLLIYFSIATVVLGL